MTFNRTLQVLLLIAVAGAVAAVGGNARAADNTAAKEVRIGFQKYGTLALLRAKGTLEPRLAKEGISVKWAEFPGGPQLLEALNIGSVDFGNTGETPPVFAQAAGADLLYVAYEPPAPAGEAILVSKDSAIKNVSDLKGKRVALNKGSNVHYLLVRALENAGLSLADIQPIYLAPADGRAAFQSGSVDAWVIWDPFQAAAEKQLDARTLKNGSGLVDNHQFYLARRPFANANARALAILLEEIRGIGEWSKQSPAEVAKQVAPVIGLPEDIALIAVKRQAYDVKRITPAVVAAQQKIADTFYNLKLIPKPLDIRSVSLLPEKAASH